MAWSKDQGKSAKVAADRAEQQANIAEGVIEEAQGLLGSAGKATQDATAAARLATEKAEYITSKQPSIDKAITDATEAKGKSAEAKTTADSVKTQFDRVVAEAGSNNPEVVQARGNEVNLNARLEKVTTQLADTAKKSEVRLKTERIGELDVTEEFRQQMLGNTPLHTVPLNNSVTLEKTTFAKIGKNLFNPSTAISGHIVNQADGTLVTSSSYTASDFISVSPNTQYTRSWDGRTAFYDSNRVFISGHFDATGNTRTITTPANASFMRCTILNSALPNYQVEKGSVQTSYEAYEKIIPKEYLEKYFDPNIVPDGSIKLNKTDFAILGKNLFDKDTVTLGYYVNQTNGTLGANSNHATSDYIPVIPSTKYSFPSDSGTRIAYYDANKTFISGAFPAISPITTPSNAKYVRYSFVAAQTNTQQFEKGGQVTSYETYGYKFVKQASAIVDNTFVAEIKLPPIIYAVVGKEVNIYFRNVFNDDISKYQFDVTCPVGVQQSERWTLMPTAVGNHSLTITVYKDYKEVASSTASVIIKASNTGAGVNRKVLIIGDSTTNDPSYSTEIVNLFGATDPMDITLLGTRGTAPALHEGRPGWTANMYLTSAEFGGVVNPFYNTGFNFSHYMSTQQYTGVDYVCINLGINDTFSFTDDTSLQAEITLILNRIQTMINSIKSFDSNIKIGMLSTIPPSYSQDSFGKSYSNGQTQWRYKRNNFLWTKAYIDYFKGKEAQGIYIVPVNTNLDTVNNMPTETVQVNSRNSATIVRQNNGVHPANTGYYQMADVFYYWVKSFET